MIQERILGSEKKGKGKRKESMDKKARSAYTVPKTRARYTLICDYVPMAIPQVASPRLATRRDRAEGNPYGSR
jgi:hypothetical protein